eukprot:10117832-Alexandrium_andersonii.AAC.1
MLNKETLDQSVRPLVMEHGANHPDSTNKDLERRIRALGPEGGEQEPRVGRRRHANADRRLQGRAQLPQRLGGNRSRLTA